MGPVGGGVAAGVVCGFVLYSHAHERPNFEHLVTRWLRGMTLDVMIKNNFPEKARAYCTLALNANGIP